MGAKGTIAGKTVVVFIGIGLAGGVLVGALFGWQYSIIGLGVALGPWVGAFFGNNKARDVDKYRERLILGRQGPPKSDGPSSPYSSEG